MSHDEISVFSMIAIRQVAIVIRRIQAKKVQ